MPASPSSSAQAARQRLGAKLRALRLAARPSGEKLTGVRFAELAGWSSPSLVSMIEKGRRSISADHVLLWCSICGTSEHRTAELLAEQANVAGMWLSWRELNRIGLKTPISNSRERYERTRLHRAYLANTVHGLLQTRAYTTAALTAVRADQGIEIDDVADAVDERMDRQAVLNRPDARWVFVLEGHILWHRVTPVEVHREQLRHLLEIMARPTISLGIIPLTADRTTSDGIGIWPEETFLITDGDLVNVELVSGYLSVTEPGEVAMYVAAWERLFGLAVHGERAAAQIRAALNAL